MENKIFERLMVEGQESIDDRNRVLYELRFRELFPQVNRSDLTEADVRAYSLALNIGTKIGAATTIRLMGEIAGKQLVERGEKSALGQSSH